MSSTESLARTTKIFSTSEFHSAVLALSPRVAVFDCDGTLWSGDAGSSFMRWTIEKSILSPEAIARHNARYQGYLAGQVSELAICGEMVQIYAGLPESTMRAAAAEFFATHIERNIFPEMLAIVHELQSRGTDIWAVSSTCDWVIEEGVRRFNIPADRVLAAQVAIANGLVTDTLLDVPTDEGKVASLARVGILTPDCVFGNSVHDAAMLAIARGSTGTTGIDEGTATGDSVVSWNSSSRSGVSSTSSGAFPINPSAALVTRAAAEHWPLYYPASVAPQTS